MENKIPKVAKCLLDENSFNPELSKLGHEDYKKLQEERIKIIGEGILKYLRGAYDVYRYASSRCSKEYCKDNLEGKITTFIYKIKSKFNGIGFNLFSLKTIIRLSTNNSLYFPTSKIKTDGDLRRDFELEKLVKDLGKENNI